MTNLVLLHKSSSKYKDQPEKHYHFPNRSYLKAMKEAIGEWIVYFEPQGKSAAARGRHVYFAAARIDRIDPDPADPDHSYARISDYLDFPELVNFRRSDGMHYESKLQQPDGSTNRGLRQRAVRRIDTVDFYSIWDTGMKVPEHLQLSDFPSFSDNNFPEFGFSESSFLTRICLTLLRSLVQLCRFQETERSGIRCSGLLFCEVMTRAVLSQT